MNAKLNTTTNVISRDGCGLAFLTQDGGVWTARGFFGEVYADHADRVTCAKMALRDPRLGTVPAGAAR
jgi:hypothetical protein